jgi:hypothetical protein
VHVTADLDGCLKLKKDWLVDENVAGLDAQGAHLLLSKVDLLSWTAPTDEIVRAQFLKLLNRSSLKFFNIALKILEIYNRFKSRSNFHGNLPSNLKELINYYIDIDVFSCVCHISCSTLNLFKYLVNIILTPNSSLCFELLST